MPGAVSLIAKPGSGETAQPHDRLRLFQFAVAAVLLAATAGAVLTAAWLLRRRPAE